LLRFTLSRVEIGGDEQERLEAEERRRESFVSNLKRVLLPVSGEGDVRAAAQLVGLMVQDEDVEVTELVLEPAHEDCATLEQEAASAVLEAHLGDPRQLVRDVDGNAAQTILTEAGRGYDLLVMTTSRRQQAGNGTPFGAGVEEVIQDAPCPLLLLSTPGPPSEEVGSLNLQHITVPVAGRPADRDAAEVAFAIAADKDIVVDLVHVVSGPQHAVRVGGDQAVLHAVEIGEDLVEQIAEVGRSMGATVECHVLVSDHPENAIVERTGQRCDLIVVRSSRRLVSQRAFFGHGTDHILKEANCPVVVVSHN
jgi:nucleotide-binding universal stress UspA family protein